jgi:glycosyltransferase involved in cell wall biosynthesis
MLNTIPKLSVIMPIYNTEKYLRLAIDSILTQTFTDFELIIIDDASTDSSLAVAESYRDPRIKVIRNDRNQGVRVTANQGHRLARAEYVARMDGDDISLPDRFKLQVDFLDAHPHIAVVGGQSIKIDTQGHKVAEYRRILPTDFASLRWYAGYECPFVNPTVMYRNPIIWGKLNGFDESVTFAEDYHLWIRLLSQNFIAHNLPDTLIEYRVNPHSMMNSVSASVRESWIIPLQRSYLDRLFDGYDAEKDLICDFYCNPTGSLWGDRAICAIESAVSILQAAYIEKYLDAKVSKYFRTLVAREKAYLGYCWLTSNRYKGAMTIMNGIVMEPKILKEIPICKIIYEILFGRLGLKLFRFYHSLIDKKT